LFRGPGAITKGGMHLEVNGSVSSQNNRSSVWFQEQILST
jgi:hypothetical protein